MSFAGRGVAKERQRLRASGQDDLLRVAQRGQEQAQQYSAWVLQAGASTGGVQSEGQRRGNGGQKRDDGHDRGGGPVKTLFAEGNPPPLGSYGGAGEVNENQKLPQKNTKAAEEGKIMGSKSWDRSRYSELMRWRREVLTVRARRSLMTSRTMNLRTWPQTSVS